MKIKKKHLKALLFFADSPMFYEERLAWPNNDVYEAIDAAWRLLESADQ